MTVELLKANIRVRGRLSLQDMNILRNNQILESQKTLNDIGIVGGEWLIVIHGERPALRKLSRTRVPSPKLDCESVAHSTGSATGAIWMEGHGNCRPQKPTSPRPNRCTYKSPSKCRETCVSLGHFFGQGWWGRICLPGEGGSRGYEVPALKWPSQHSVLAQLSHPLSHSRTHWIAGSNGQGSKSAIMKYPLRPQTAVLWPKIVRVGLSGWFRSL